LRRPASLSGDTYLPSARWAAVSRKPYLSKNRLHFGADLISEAGILHLLEPLYQSIGGNPKDLVAVTRSYGGWLVALRFCVHRADGATAWVTRVDLDSADQHRLIKALKSFDAEPKAGCVPSADAMQHKSGN
jgi:hypothetical protein